MLFDYSGVLTTPLHLPTENVPYDPDAVMVEMAAALVSPEAHPWHALERGEITLTTFADYVEAKVAGASAIVATDSEHNVMANLALLDDRISVAQECKALGLRVGLVTNNVAEWQPLWLPRLPTGLFEIIIDSSAVGCRKPEPEIYELAMERMGIADPSTVLFIDDFEWNVTGAIALGMRGLHCTADLDLQSAITNLLG